jgi:hypothetical protein
MKKVPLFLIASVLLFTACKKNAVETVAKKPAKLAFQSAAKIPNEIVPLLYNEMIKRGLTTQAEKFRMDYYQTLSQRKDGNTDLLKKPYDNTEVIMGADLNDRTVTGVGVVLDGNWDETNVSFPSSAHVQDYGDINRPFNAMNSTAPEAFVSTTPSSTQILGTNDPKRMQKFRICTLRYGVADNLSTTYFTGSFALRYQSFVQDHPGGWMSTVTSPSYSGTDLAKRIQAIKIYGPSAGNLLTFNDAAPSTQAELFIFYRAHQQDYPGGWLPWQAEGGEAGEHDEAKRVQGLQVRAYLIKI